MRKVPGFSANKFDPVEDFYMLEEISFLDVANASLKDFKENGGKLLMYQGWNDFPLRAGRALEFFDQANELNGGPDQTEDFFRLFMVPWMVHCGAGPGAWLTDYVAPIVDWREKDVAPEKLIATQNSWKFGDPEETMPAKTGGFSRPICPFPKLAEYDGKGDENQADSFSCKVP